MRRVLMGLLIATGVGYAGLAAEGIEEELAFLAQEKVSVASKHEESVRDAPAAVSVLRAEDFARFGDRTVGDALQRIPGWYMTDSHETVYVGVRGYNPSGAYNREVLVLMNGHALNENWSASAYVDEFLMIDISLIDHIEVLSGPSSTLYGTNAFFGIINIVTKNAAIARSFELKLLGMDDGTGKAVVTSGKEFSSGFSYVGSASYYRSTGVSYTFEELGRADQDTDRDRKWDGFFETAYKDFSFQGGYVTREKAIPTAPYGTIFNDRRNTYTFDMGFAEAKYDHEFSDDLRLSAHLAHSVFQYNDDLAYNDDPDNYPDGYLFHDTGDDRTDGGELQLDWNVGKRNRLIVGVAGSHSITLSHSSVVQPSGDPGFTIPIDLSTYAAYVQGEFALGSKVFLRGGLRYDGNTRFKSSVSPRVALIIYVGEPGTVKLIVGKGFRNPSPYEAFFDDGYSILPNPELKPQILWHTEAMYEYRSQSGYFLRGSVFAIRGEDFFQQNTVNLGGIPCEDPGADCRERISNTGRTRAKGAELAFEAQPRGGLRAYGNVSYQDVVDPDSSFDFFNSPKWLAKAGLSYPLVAKRLYLGGDVSYVSRRNALDETDLTVDPSTNLGLTLYVPSLFGHLDLTLAVRNALDRENYEPVVSEDIAPIQRIPQEGRTARLFATLKF